jgi:hypothetical protein
MDQRTEHHDLAGTKGLLQQPGSLADNLPGPFAAEGAAWERLRKNAA